MLPSLYHQTSNKYYIKKDKKSGRKIARVFGGLLFLGGILFGGYFFYPLLSWQIFLEPAFASKSITAPIPETTIVTKDYIQSLWMNTARSIQNLYDNNSNDWIPSSPYKDAKIATQLSYYFLSIPKLNITNAVVSTVDVDLSQHLVNFPGSAIPPATGTADIFGHSTLPQLYDPKNYKTIFAYAHTLVVGDDFLVTADNKTYTYKIYDISIVDADDTSYLTQQTDNSYLVLITCTPPGTTWKRLIIRSRLEKI